VVERNGVGREVKGIGREKEQSLCGLSKGLSEEVQGQNLGVTGDPWF
jgi:hypothetical protein